MALVPPMRKPLPPVDVTAPGPTDSRLFSVTTLIGCLEKPGLLYWAAEEAAKAAIHNERTWKAIRDEQGEAEAIKWLRDSRFRKPKDKRSATELGTAVHDACERYAITGERPVVDDEVRPYLEQFDRWCQRFSPVYEAAEMTVYSPRYGFAGTLDAVLSVSGLRVIADYKSTRKSVDDKGNPSEPYPEVSLQLAAYRHAEFAAAWRARRHEYRWRRYYLLSDEERAMSVPVPEVDGGLCIQITPDSCIAYPVACGPDLFEQFLYVLEAARFVLETSKHVIGPPLIAAPMGVG